MKLQKIWRVPKLEREKADQNVAGSFKSLEISNPPALDSDPCISTSTKTVELHARDSGYGSASSTPVSKDTGTPLRKPGQIPLIQQLGLCVSNKAMEPKTKGRFLEVQLEIEKMLLEFMRKLKSSPGMYKPIAIRPMMLGKTDSDADARSYMVVICSEKIKRKVQDFFDEPLVKSLCEPDDDDMPSFKALVIGHALRLRASTSDISVQCSPVHNLYDGTTTFCGMPIRLCGEHGHSRKATFGGLVKVLSTDGEYQLYGLTAGHVIRDGQINTHEDDTCLETWDGTDLVDLDLGEGNHTRTAPPAVSDDNNHDGPDNLCFGDRHHLGKVLEASRGEALVDEEHGQMNPYLDWALFELNVHRPNQLAYIGREYSKGDLHLPFSIIDPRQSGIPVSMLCASQGVKHGMLSTTRARVLLYPGDSFTDAYTLSLEGSEVSDGDSGSWVVDELRLEVYGHVVADDVFGDAYVIPMSDILADIQRCLGAESVDLPSGLDIISMASLQHPGLFAPLNPRDRSFSQLPAERPEDVADLKGPGKSLLSVAKAGYPFGNMTSTEFLQWPLPTSSSVDAPSRPVSVLEPDTVFIDQILNSGSVDSGYSSLGDTPTSSPAPLISRPGPHDDIASKAQRKRTSKAFMVADRHGMTTPSHHRYPSSL